MYAQYVYDYKLFALENLSLWFACASVLLMLLSFFNFTSLQYHAYYMQTPTILLKAMKRCSHNNPGMSGFCLLLMLI